MRLTGLLAAAPLFLGLMGGAFESRAIGVRTVAGGPESQGAAPYGNVNGITFYAMFNGPSGCALDAQGNLYIADRTNHAIRKITSPTDDPAGTNYNSVTTTYISLSKSPIGLAIESNTLYVATLEKRS